MCIKYNVCSIIGLPCGGTADSQHATSETNKYKYYCASMSLVTDYLPDTDFSSSDLIDLNEYNMPSYLCFHFWLPHQLVRRDLLAISRRLS